MGQQSFIIERGSADLHIKSDRNSSGKNEKESLRENTPGKSLIVCDSAIEKGVSDIDKHLA